MILSYRDKQTEAFANGTFVREFQGFDRQAWKRLEILDAATSLDDLRNLPGNRLASLMATGAASTASANKPGLRMTVEGMLYRMRTGCPWRDLPKAFGCWNRIYKRFNAWSSSGKWLGIFKTLVVEPDLEWAFLDGSYAKAHQHSAGAASDTDEAIGKSRAGNTSKIHLAVDAHGLPIEFEITGGQINDCTVAPTLIGRLQQAETIIADKGYDSKSIRAAIASQGARVVIPRKRNSTQGNADLDRGLYRYRHLVENTFARLKQYRAVASRFDKLKRNYESVVAMACMILWLPM